MKKLNSNYLKRQVVFLAIASLLLSGVSFLVVGAPFPDPPPNQPPEAVIVSITPNPAFVGDNVSFVGMGYDPENCDKYFSWDFDGDGTWDVVDVLVEGFDWVYYYVNYTYSSPGTYTVVLMVKDIEDASDTDTAVVVILDLPPTVDITYPNEGQTVHGTITIAGTASDPDSNLTLVEIKIDEGNWSIATGTNNWEYNWDTHTVEEGRHTIIARSRDDYGNYSDVDIVNVTVKFIPDLECVGTLGWNSVKPGATVNGSFMVQNVGEVNSKLDWEIIEFPQDWGTWTFDPSSGTDLTPGQGPFTVNVTVVAPNQQNHQFTGNIKIVNKENTGDNETISVSLTTPRNRLSLSPILLQICKKIIGRFPILAKLLGINSSLSI